MQPEIDIAGSFTPAEREEPEDLLEADGICACLETWTAEDPLIAFLQDIPLPSEEQLRESFGRLMDKTVRRTPGGSLRLNERLRDWLDERSAGEKKG